MRKITLLIILLSFAGWGQITDADSLINSPWKTSGKFNFIFNQSSFTNWTAGGESNLSGTALVNYDINYSKGLWHWDTKLLAAYGLIKIKDDTFEKKTDDRIEIYSIVGKKGEGNWYISSFFNFKTQLTIGYKYSKNSEGETIRTEFTDFLSPAILSSGPGFQWKKNANFNFNLAPATSRVTLVNKRFTATRENYFGVKQSETSRYELGFTGSGYLKFEAAENITVEQILHLFSNYLDNFQNVDVDYSLNIGLKINKYLDTSIMGQLIYDDNAFAGLQIREIFGLGVNFLF